MINTSTLSLYLENLTELFRHLLFGSAYSRMVGNTNCVAPFHVRLWICQDKLCKLVLSSVWLAEKAVSQQGQRATLGCRHTWAHRQPSKHPVQSALCFAPHRDEALVHFQKGELPKFVMFSHSLLSQSLLFKSEKSLFRFCSSFNLSNFCTVLSSHHFKSKH